MTQSISFTYPGIEPSLFWRSTKAITKARGKNKSHTRLWTVAAWFALVFAMLGVLQLDVLQDARTKPLVGAFVTGVIFMAIAAYASIWIQRKRMSTILTQTQTLQGTVSVELGPDGFRAESAFGDCFLKWQGIEEIHDLQTGTGLRSGLMIYPLPNEALPEGLTPEDFRQKLEAWRAES